MKPETSRLLLDNYFLARLSVEANARFDPKAAMNLSANDISVESASIRTGGDARKWQVSLKVFHQSKDGVNAPYFFCVEAVGFFSVAESYPAERAEWLVKTNASSILYSVVREALRSAMAAGPWKPVILPAVSFYTDEVRKFLNGDAGGK